MDRSSIPASLPFSLPHTLEIVRRTPAVLDALLRDLSMDWIHHNEGPETWTPFDVLGHLVHGEKTDRMVRVNKCPSVDDKYFVPFDRFAQYTESEGKTINALLDEFAALRSANMVLLQGMDLSEEQLDSTGIHPTFGEVRLRHFGLHMT